MMQKRLGTAGIDKQRKKAIALRGSGADGSIVRDMFPQLLQGVQEEVCYGFKGDWHKLLKGFITTEVVTESCGLCFLGDEDEVLKQAGTLFNPCLTLLTFQTP